MAIAILFLHTGIRVSELTKLELVNLDLGRGQIKITRKGDKEQYLHLNGETVNMLARYLANRPEAPNGRFFADVAVLVEGEEDRATIIGAAYMMNLDLESMGITIIPCHGKNNLDRPVAILSKLQIPTYTLWDSDEGETDANPKDNHRLLRLFGQPIEDWPYCSGITGDQ